METFERAEQKYLMSRSQQAAFLGMCQEHLEPAEYFHSNVVSIYYDTKDDRLIRNSLEKPLYKEKLRIRSYSTPKEGDRVFVELKKKYKGIVYKRRTEVVYDDLLQNGLQSCLYESEQIGKEIRWFDRFYETLEPKILISTHRTSFIGKQDPTLRITFDDDVTCRREDLDMRHGIDGENLLEEGQVLMEVKISESMPLWLSHILNELQIYPRSYSKYGTAYTKEKEGGKQDELLRNDIFQHGYDRPAADRNAYSCGTWLTGVPQLHV